MLLEVWQVVSHLLILLQGLKGCWCLTVGDVKLSVGLQEVGAKAEAAKPSAVALSLAEALAAAGIRVETDCRNEKINYKVREHSLAKVPHLLVVGKREADEGTVAVRTLGAEHQKVMSLAEAIAMLKSEGTPPDLKAED